MRYNEIVRERAATGTRGQAALSFVFLVVTIIILVATTLALVVTSFLNSTFGFQASERAAAGAAAGGDDALMQLIRNKEFSDIVGYTVPVGGGSATVTVTQLAGQATIVSVGSLSIYERRVRAVVSVDPVTGRVTILSRQRT